MRYLIVCAALLAGTTAFGQAQKRAPLSPAADTAVTINGKSISIKYSAPSLRGRQFIGGLHQYGQVWRAGANAATSLHTDANLKIGSLTVPAGDYTLYVLLDQTAWQLVVNKQTGQWGTVYKQDQDLGRVPMTMAKPDSPIETYRIVLTDKGNGQASLELAWENSIATVPITVQ